MSGFFRGAPLAGFLLEASSCSSGRPSWSGSLSWGPSRLLSHNVMRPHVMTRRMLCSVLFCLHFLPVCLSCLLVVLSLPLRFSALSGLVVCLLFFCSLGVCLSSRVVLVVLGGALAGCGVAVCVGWLLFLSVAGLLVCLVFDGWISGVETSRWKNIHS